MTTKFYKNKIEIILPLKNEGKFRWKNRSSSNDYGVGFATAQIPFKNESYLEWQIGYDVQTKDISVKPTTLNKKSFIFVGANGKDKYPYELSELLYHSLKNGLISNKDFNDAFKKIKAIKDTFADLFKIQMSPNTNYTLNGVNYIESDITLPAFSFDTGCGPYIDISIEKQQYATGIQPMVYLSIPINQFQNYANYIGKVYNKNTIDSATFIIDKNNSSIILNLFKIFASCSSKHNHDVIEIMTLFKNYFKI